MSVAFVKPLPPRERVYKVIARFSFVQSRQNLDYIHQSEYIVVLNHLKLKVI